MAAIRGVSSVGVLCDGDSSVVGSQFPSRRVVPVFFCLVFFCSVSPGGVLGDQTPGFEP